MFVGGGGRIKENVGGANMGEIIGVAITAAISGLLTGLMMLGVKKFRERLRKEDEK